MSIAMRPAVGTAARSCVLPRRISSSPSPVPALALRRALSAAAKNKKKVPKMPQNGKKPPAGQNDNPAMPTPPPLSRWAADFSPSSAAAAAGGSAAAEPAGLVLYKSKFIFWLRVLRFGTLGQLAVCATGIPAFVFYDRLEELMGLSDTENRTLSAMQDKASQVLRDSGLGGGGAPKDEGEEVDGGDLELGAREDGSSGSSSNSSKEQQQPLVAATPDPPSISDDEKRAVRAQYAAAPLFSLGFGERVAIGAGLMVWTGLSVALLRWVARYHVTAIELVNAASRSQPDTLRIRWFDVVRGTQETLRTTPKNIVKVDTTSHQPWWTVHVREPGSKNVIPFKVDRDGTMPNRPLFMTKVLKKSR
jgi:hypothetical protein